MLGAPVDMKRPASMGVYDTRINTPVSNRRLSYPHKLCGRRAFGASRSGRIREQRLTITPVLAAGPVHDL
jgi:hypothetical protein